MHAQTHHRLRADHSLITPLTFNAQRGVAHVIIMRLIKLISGLALISSTLLMMNQAHGQMTDSSGSETEPMTQTSQARRARFMTTPRVASMGSAGIGGSRATSALMLNPAGMLSDISYVVDANYFRTRGEDNLLNINITDSQTSKNKFALGLGYQANLADGDIAEHHAQIGLAIPLFNAGSTPVIGGLNGHYLYQAEDEDDHFDIDLGVMLPLSQVLSVGVVGAQLLDDDRQIWGAGVGLTNKSFSGHFDLLHSFNVVRTELRAGLEWLLSDRFVLRGGYIHMLSAELRDEEGPSAFSLGAAILKLGTGRGRVNLSYQRALMNDEYTFGAGFSLYLDDHRRTMR